MSKIRKLIVEGPFSISLPRKTTKDKKISVNYNRVSNLHFLEKNQMKKLYTEQVKEQLQGKALETPVTVTYKVFKPTKRRLDKMNVCFMSSKFMLDAMTEFGVIPDDNDDHIKEELLLNTELDRENPRIEFTFTTEEKD